MIFYIELPVERCKAQYLVSEYDGKIIKAPKQFKDIVSDESLICVVDNGPFEVAIYCHNIEQFIALVKPEDVRKKKWLLMDTKLAKKLSGFKQ